MRGFANVASNERGYDTTQVDNFFIRARDPHSGLDETDVRAAAFDLVAGGYDPEQVDHALDRLEESYSRRHRRELLENSGNAGLERHIARLSATLTPRLERPAGERFADAADQGYAKGAVDHFMERVEDYLHTGGGLDESDVRMVTFPPAHEAKAYHEGVVDAYLDRVIEVILARK